ncbi:MAG: NAD(P)-binding protein, partial [Candidatus Latescibacteria bacterium]|nr:NAD(P)-binding protein [Candidatus Latescibacterota bacterium]NIT02494.1 NAD(P)-binding protein [Candidatus Latescibacterota bacterium]
SAHLEAPQFFGHNTTLDRRSSQFSSPIRRRSLSSQQEMNFHVAVIGAGPAGLYAAKHLASEGIKVALFNRDIKPGGLAEYGIYPTKH